MHTEQIWHFLEALGWYQIDFLPWNMVPWRVSVMPVGTFTALTSSRTTLWGLIHLGGIAEALTCSCHHMLSKPCWEDSFASKFETNFGLIVQQVNPTSLTHHHGSFPCLFFQLYLPPYTQSHTQTHRKRRTEAGTRKQLPQLCHGPLRTNTSLS